MDIKLVVSVIAALVIAALYLRYTNKVRTALIAAFIVSLVWTALYPYEYVGENVLLFHRINVFPLTLWTLGLTSLYLVHTRVRMFRGPLAVILLHLGMLAVIEITGYYMLNIRLVGDFTSLLGLGVIHAPLATKIFYLVAGPLFIFALDTYNKRRHSWHQSIKAALAIN